MGEVTIEKILQKEENDFLEEGYMCLTLTLIRENIRENPEIHNAFIDCTKVDKIKS